MRVGEDHGLLPLVEALLELVLGRPQIAGQLGYGCPAKEEHDDHDEDDHPIDSEYLCQHLPLLCLLRPNALPAPCHLLFGSGGPSDVTSRSNGH